MLDYPKLEEYKKGGRVKIINKSIIKKKKMKQKQTQKQIVNVYTHAPAKKRTYRRSVKKVEPQQRILTLAPVRAELPSYIYSKPSSTLPTLNPPQQLGLPTLPQQLATKEQEDKLKESNLLYDMMQQIKKMKNFQQNQEQKIKEKTEKLPTFSDTSSLPDLYEPTNNNLPVLPSNNDAKEELKELSPEIEKEELEELSPEIEKQALIQDALFNNLYDIEDIPEAEKMTDKELLNDVSEFYNNNNKIVVEYVSKMNLADLQALADLNGINKQTNLKNSLVMRDKSKNELKKELNAKGIFNNLQLLTPS